MRLELVRRWFTPVSTIGELSINGASECFVLEDRFRLPFEAKVPQRTAIPCGIYSVAITHSPRFGLEMPLLLDVPGYQGVRIHPGNTPADTEGCLLPGWVRERDRVLQSREAYARLFQRLREGESATLTITALFT